MATYCNQHWLLCHIRNSFVSTDDTGICETVMQSDDLPKHYLRKFQTDFPISTRNQRKSLNATNGSKAPFVDRPLQEVDFVCYPGLDISDDEDFDFSAQSFDIQMYPEVGAYRFRSNTAQKLEKMDIARRKAARTKSVNFDDDIVPPEQNDYFVKKQLTISKSPKKENKQNRQSELSKAVKEEDGDDDLEETGIKSKLSLQLANSPKQPQNKFMEYARFDGTSQVGIQIKKINVFLNMLPERERNYPIKICVLASAKIQEVIGLVCYKASIKFPEIPLKSIRHYALYMTEDNDDLEDFPPLDNREPCSKFGFSHLTLAERRSIVPVTRIDYNNTLNNSLTSEEDKAQRAAVAVDSLKSIRLNGGQSDEQVNKLSSTSTTTPTEEHLHDDYDPTMSHHDILLAPRYRTYRLNIIDKRFFKTEVTLGISGECIEINQQKHAKFWSKQKAVTYPIEAVAFCEIVERRNTKAILRIHLKSSSSLTSTSSASSGESRSGGGSSTFAPHSPTSPSHGTQLASSPFNFFHMANSNDHHHMRFKHYDFEGPIETATHILKQLNCILEVQLSEARKEFLIARERKLEKLSKKQLKS